MVGIEGGNLVDVNPFHAVLQTQLLAVVLDIDQRIVGNRYDALAGVAVNATESTHLAHIQVVESRQRLQCAFGGVVNALVGSDEASIEAPLATSGIHLASADEHLQLLLIETEDDDVDRHPDFRMFNIVSHCNYALSIKNYALKTAYQK